MERMENNVPSDAPKIKWYWKTSFLIFMLLSFGPFALPLLWFNPRFSSTQKLLWTVITAMATYYLAVLCMSTFKSAMQQARDLGLIQ